jgi:hypothetical protein
MLLSILIVYGITLIIVQGKIFNNTKIQLSKFITYIESYYNPQPIDIANMVINNHKYISEQHLTLYNNILLQFNDVKNKPKQEELGNLLESLREKIRISILEQRKFKILFKCFSYILNKTQELINCMMCTGFWVGIVLSIITLNFNISICGSLLNLVTTQGYFSICLTVFLLGGLYSGTTWAINSMVDFFVEIKDSLKSYLDKKSS